MSYQKMLPIYKWTLNRCHFHSQMSIRGGAKTGKALLITAAVLLSVGIVLLIVMMLMKPPSEPAVVTASPKAKRNSRMAVELSIRTRGA